MSMLIFNPNETPAPCDTCPHADRCYSEKLACERFDRFTNSLLGGKRVPTREMYMSIFERDKLLEMQAKEREEKKNNATAVRRRYLRELNRRVMARASIVQPEMFRKKGASA